MVVGVMTWQLHMPESRSLKDKRHVVRGLKDRLRARFNVSAAETDHLELWQRAALTVAVVSNERAHAEQVLRDADRLVHTASAFVLDTTAAWM